MFRALVNSDLLLVNPAYAESASQIILNMIKHAPNKYSFSLLTHCYVQRRAKQVPGLCAPMVAAPGVGGGGKKEIVDQICICDH